MTNYSSLLTTGGKFSFQDSGFKINYRVTGEPVKIWSASGSPFLFTIFNCPSGSGKTTFISNVYNYLRNISCSLKFDFQPDHVLYDKCSYGYIPQNAPLPLHWKTKDFLPTQPKFLDCFFDSEKQNEILSKRLGQFSGGQRRKLYVCSVVEKLFMQGELASFLILDEVFDGLGANEAKRCIGHLSDKWVEKANKPLFVILVSHLEELNIIPDSMPTLKLGLVVEEESIEELTVKIYNKPC